MMLTFCILITLLCLYVCTINFRKIYLAFKIPGPFPLPFLGNALLFFNKSPSETRAVGERLQREYGNTFAVWIGPALNVTISDRKSVEFVLNNPIFNEKSSAYNFMRPWLNEGLLVSKGSKWHQRRKILTPAFHFKVLEQYVKVFNRQSSVFIETLSKFSETDKVELIDLIGLCTLDIICETAMGVEINAQQNSDSEYVNAVKTILKVLNLRVFSFFHRVDLFFQFTRSYKEQTNALKILHGFTDKVISERRKKLLKDKANRNNNDDNSKTKNTLLDILLQSTINGKPLTDLDIREEVDTFMVEGHDTTKSALTFCFYAIAKYPEVQLKCFQEIRDVIGDDCQTPVSLNDLNNLRYLDLVIKETLRIFPSIPLIGRRNKEEVTIGEYRIPKGTDLIIAPHFLTHNPKLFTDPLEFRPERFLEYEYFDQLAFLSYLPFSAGPRNCIGQKYATLEMKTLVTKVLRHLEISLAEDSQEFPSLVGEMILISENKINFHLKPRLY